VTNILELRAGGILDDVGIVIGEGVELVHDIGTGSVVWGHRRQPLA